MSSYIDIVFDGPPGPVSGRFVEVENAEGRSINAGEWIEDAPFWRLRIPAPGGLNPEAVRPMYEALKGIEYGGKYGSCINGGCSYLTGAGHHELCPVGNAIALAESS